MSRMETRAGGAGRKPISWREREAIIAALRAEPDAIEAVAERFGRSPSTIGKLRQSAQLKPWSRKSRLMNKLEAERAG